MLTQVKLVLLQGENRGLWTTRIGKHVVCQGGARWNEPTFQDLLRFWNPKVDLGLSSLVPTNHSIIACISREQPLVGKRAISRGYNGVYHDNPWQLLFLLLKRLLVVPMTHPGHGRKCATVLSTASGCKGSILAQIISYRIQDFVYVQFCGCSCWFGGYFNIYLESTWVIQCH